MHFESMMLDHALNRNERVVQFPLRQVKPGFYCSERDLSFRGDFPLAHPFEKCQVNHLFLRLRQFLNHPAKKL
jgi:hypothetical protein